MSCYCVEVRCDPDFSKLLRERGDLDAFADMVVGLVKQKFVICSVFVKCFGEPFNVYVYMRTHLGHNAIYAAMDEVSAELEKTAKARWNCVRCFVL